MKAFFQLIGIVLICALIGVFLFFAIGWALVLILVAFSAFFLAWLFGVPIKVTKNGQVIGHLVRTKFIPLRNRF